MIDCRSQSVSFIERILVVPLSLSEVLVNLFDRFLILDGDIGNVYSSSVRWTTIPRHPMYYSCSTRHAKISDCNTYFDDNPRSESGDLMIVCMNGRLHNTVV